MKSHQETQTRRSGRVPKKKVPFSNEIPVPKKRVKRKSDEAFVSPKSSPVNKAKVLPTKKAPSQKVLPPPKKKEPQKELEEYPVTTESSAVSMWNA